MIDLPDPGDVQVATAWPAVDTYRVAVGRARALRDRAGRTEDSLLRTFRTLAGRATPAADRIRNDGYRRFEEATREAVAAEAVLSEVRAAAVAVAPAAAERARLSPAARAANRAAERASRHALG